VLKTNQTKSFNAALPSESLLHHSLDARDPHSYDLAALKGEAKSYRRPILEALVQGDLEGGPGLYTATPETGLIRLRTF
jgi:VIT1/CCC1 family predicted Fe2+/Mn2+ transporter